MCLIRTLLQTAIEQFNINDKYLIENDLSERCICSRLAYHIQQQIDASTLRGYVVDVEYNRGAEGNERSPKHIQDDEHNQLIVVDLIVHKRGYDNQYGFDNLFCIEMKKDTNRCGYEKDLVRLNKLVSRDYGFNYKYGFMVVAEMKKCKLTIASAVEGSI